MRWLRPTVPHEAPEEALEAALDDVARSLEAAAHEAPPSRRAEEARAAVLDELDRGGRPALGLVPLAMAAAVLALAFFVGVGAPAVGSWISERLEASPPAEADRLEPPVAPTLVEMPLNEDPAVPTQSGVPTPPATPDPSSADAGAEPSWPPAGRPEPVPPVAPAPSPADDGGPPPQASPGGPPMPMPTPSVGPPPGTPGG